MKLSHITRQFAFAAALTLTIVAAALAAPNADRDCFFGQTHVHTSWSLDAYVIGNTVTGPEECLSIRAR